MAAKIYLMRWNPAISSYKLEVYHNNCKDFPDGFRIDWSVWDYAEAHEGDCFVMMRVGEYKPGLVFYGVFVSEPYADEDWAGTDKMRHYVLMDCFGFNENDEPIVSPEELSDAIPEIDWMTGHSGMMLSEEEAERLTALLEAKVEDFSFNPDAVVYIDDWVDPSERLAELLEKFSEYSPSVHTQDEEGYDWLESCAEWCKCLVIPNPVNRKSDVKIETAGEFILYFGGSHGHYSSDEEDFEALGKDMADIINSKCCAYSVKYEGWGWSEGMANLEPSAEKIREFILEDDEYFVSRLAEYTEKDIKPEGVLTIDLRYFNPLLNKSFSFRLDELSHRLDEYQKRQEEVKALYGNQSQED